MRLLITHAAAVAVFSFILVFAVQADPLDGKRSELLASPTPALAEPRQPPPRMPNGGTHFLAELAAGPSLNAGTLGFSTLTRFGAGGRLPNFPLRFYLLGELGFTSHSQQWEQGRGVFSERGSLWQLALGVRMYAPLAAGFRLFLEGFGGTSLAQGEVETELGTQLNASAWEATASLGAGLQLRVSRAVSVGGQLRVTFTGDPLADELTSVGISSDRRATPFPVSFLFGGAWHF